METNFIKKDFNLLKTELELCKKEGNERWGAYLEVHFAFSIVFVQFSMDVFVRGQLGVCVRACVCV